jgi:hypothetical protein
MDFFYSIIYQNRINIIDKINEIKIYHYHDNKDDTSFIDYHSMFDTKGDSFHKLIC